MREYRGVILTLLAGLTAVFLGTAVYALRSWSTVTLITYNELHKQTQREMPLRAPERGADYLALIPDEPGFREALTPLLLHREEEGLRVTAVSLSQIVAEFGNDTGSAQAMREFLRYAAENWQPTPRYLLLAGDAASPSAAQPDAPNRNLLPTHLVSQGSSQAADDGWFVTFDDSGPQMTVGRLPVQTAEELTTVVAKTIAYETAVSQTPNAAWLRRALLIADDKPYFDMAQDQLEDSLYQNGYHIHDLHMSQNQDIYFNIVTVLNRGVGILNYTGHGSESNFGDGAAFTAEDARLLENEERLPLFTAFSCQNGAFSDPVENSVAEQLLLAPNGGVAAAVGASGATETESSLILASVFYHVLLDGSNATLGEALNDMKTAVRGDEELETAVRTYNLLGDPALALHKPAAGQLARPLPLLGPTTFVNDH